jgi:hypothetical protein
MNYCGQRIFGGLSGHQGALRSALLLQAGQIREAFITSGIVIAVMIDVARLGMYASRFRQRETASGRV